jgi:hypothetical protein
VAARETVRDELTGQLEGAIERARPGSLPEWRQANQDYAIARFMERYGGQADQQNMTNSLTNSVGRIAAIASGSNIGGMVAQTAMQHGVRTLGPGLIARTGERTIGALNRAADSLQAFARADPNGLARAMPRQAPVLIGALARGGDAFNSAYFLLSQRDADFRQRMQAMDAEESSREDDIFGEQPTYETPEDVIFPQQEAR